MYKYSLSKTIYRWCFFFIAGGSTARHKVTPTLTHSITMLDRGWQVTGARCVWLINTLSKLWIHSRHTQIEMARI